MTPPKESSIESASKDVSIDPGRMQDLFDSAQTDSVEVPVHIRSSVSDKSEVASPAPEPERDLFSELRAMRRADGEFDGIQNIDVQKDKDFEEGIELAFAGVKSITELKKRAAAYESLPDPDGGMKQLIKPNERGWFDAIPGDQRSDYIIGEINKRRTELTKAADEKLARSKLYKTFSWAQQKNQEQNDAEAAVKERLTEERKDKERLNAWHDENEAEHNKNKAEAIDEVLDEAHAENMAFDIRRENEVQEKVGLKSIEEETISRQNEAVRPLNARLLAIRERHSIAREQAVRRGLSDERLKDIDAKYSHEAGKIWKEIETTAKAIKEAVLAEDKKLDSVSNEQIEKLIDFRSAENPEPHIFEPDGSFRPDMAAMVARDNAEEMGRRIPPMQEDEYKIGDTIMQRIVYRTEDVRTFIVEDWDKTSGKLKRQSMLKGDNLIVPSYENDGSKRIKKALNKRSADRRYVLSNEAYSKIGFITKEQVSADSGTSYSEGYSTYTQNLVRSGIDLKSARERASHTFKPRKEKGFIQLLQENFTKSGASKKIKK